ncbi:MAG: CBS domain-containing protein, partial [Gammaproteobacteria bacterium]|nr:CBS domain-containing protein [Gemmatimonadota bacterium]NIU77480.1 CBS domain-containing protein [Gammaproteobacteria bacterium]
SLQHAIVHADTLDQLLVAGELARDDVPTVTPDDNLDTVSRIFAERSLDELPVVEPRDGRLVGVVASYHLLAAYNRELLKRDMVTSIGSGLEAAAAHDVGLGQGYR